MTTVLMILAVILGLIGIIGSIVPAIPGPPISWVGLLLAYIAREAFAPSCLWVLMAVTIIVTVLDYVLPSLFTKFSGGSKYAGWGALIGMFAGMVFPIVPLGMIGGCFLGAFLFELAFANKSAGESLLSAFAAFAGFIFTTGIKLAVCGVMMYYIVVSIFA